MAEETPLGAKDEALADCFARLELGDASAVDELYRQSGRRLYGYLAALLGSAADAEDALHEVFLDVTVNYRRFGRARRPWLYMLAAARNRAMRMMKRRPRFESLDGLVLVAPFASDTAASAQEAQAVSDALKSLPREQREVVVLKVWENLTFRQIAQVTGSPQDTVASRYRYALEKIGRSLAAGSKRK